MLLRRNGKVYESYDRNKRRYVDHSWDRKLVAMILESYRQTVLDGRPFDPRHAEIMAQMLKAGEVEDPNGNMIPVTGRAFKKLLLFLALVRREQARNGISDGRTRGGGREGASSYPELPGRRGDGRCGGWAKDCFAGEGREGDRRADECDDAEGNPTAESSEPATSATA